MSKFASPATPAKMHYYIIAAEVAYWTEAGPRARRLNTILELPKQFVTMEALDGARRTGMARLVHEGGIPEADLADYVVLSVTYLGYGTQEAFTKSSSLQPETPTMN